MLVGSVICHFFNLFFPQTCDILSPTSPYNNQYDVCIDKGTYDAISLNPDAPDEKRSLYVKNVAAMLVDEGLLILTSCNWTQEELNKHFTVSGDASF